MTNSNRHIPNESCNTLYFPFRIMLLDLPICLSGALRPQGIHKITYVGDFFGVASYIKKANRVIRPKWEVSGRDDRYVPEP